MGFYTAHAMGMARGDVTRNDELQTATAGGRCHAPICGV